MRPQGTQPPCRATALGRGTRKRVPSPPTNRPPGSRFPGSSVRGTAPDTPVCGSNQRFLVEQICTSQGAASWSRGGTRGDPGRGGGRAGGSGPYLPGPCSAGPRLQAGRQEGTTPGATSEGALGSARSGVRTGPTGGSSPRIWEGGEGGRPGSEIRGRSQLPGTALLAVPHAAAAFLRPLPPSAPGHSPKGKKN